MVIISGFKLVSTTILPKTASTSIKKKAPNAKYGIRLLVFRNLVDAYIKNKNTKPAKTEANLLIYSVQVWYLLNLL